MSYKLIFLFDGECPLCRRETNFLKKKDSLNNIEFVDISKSDFNPKDYQNISYLEAMNNLHGILDGQKIIKGLDVLSYSYDLVGLGWIYYPLKLPYISDILRLFYKLWAKYRLPITGRSNEEKICSSRCFGIE